MTNKNDSNRQRTATGVSLPKILIHQDGVEWERVYPQEIDRAQHPYGSAVRTLLVPLDGSLSAEHALPHALAIARRSNATVRLVHVHSRLDSFEPWQVSNGPETLERRKHAKQNYLLDVAKRIARISDVPLATMLIDSTDTEESLLKAAATADLVVMASHRRGLFRQLWSYSVAEGLRRRLRRPLLLVKGYESPVDLTGDPIARHILIPLDGSRLAEHILGPATALGGLDAAAVSLLNVQSEECTTGAFENTSPMSYLRSVAHRVKDSFPIVGAHVVTTDQPIAPAVVSFAERREVDLIAITTHGDGGLTRLLRGSVVDALVRRTNFPILVLRHDIDQKRTKATNVLG